ncbi:hypothetical protein CRM79_00700 [Pantoea agglomerans]|uniref:hypothetical protein n=1 Tax=Pantoea TaxID=53335 RepID=UPI000BF186BC|nr:MULTISPECIES: hypothetical protein [Pantoea]MDE8558601.1 hypothetical protein [Pantoea vagans]MDE8578517.1 hypothetical protein [Pantoea vagans]PEI06351.1 hypothetical protein CRM79_00700 [Pantoea agglomerans]GME46507.1 hypothetical protein ACJ3_40740 [Pantoea sp. QMID3]GME46559.1 hypothetical protein ACJ1_40500 [Pantoea sp. QMID1]
MSGLLSSLTTLGGSSLTSASNSASKTLEGAMSDSLTQSANAQASKMKLDTQNSILDGKMDSATKEINSGHNAAKAIQF